MDRKDDMPNRRRSAMAGTSSPYKKKKTSKDPSFRKKKPLAFYPVQRKISLRVLPTSTTTSPYGIIDVARMASLTNRRLYRNGKMFSCKLSMDPTALPAGAKVEVWSIRPNWSNIRAWELAKENFDQSYEDERENISKAQQARWFDFRVNHGLGSICEFTPWVDNNMDPSLNVTLGPGEFDLSIVEDSTGTERTFTWSNAPAASEYAILKEFSEGYRSAQTPAFTTGDGPYDQLHADSSQKESEALQAKGNQAPYDGTVQTGAVWTKVGVLAMGAEAGTFSTSYFDAPCGFIGLRISGISTMGEIAGGISLELQSGDYKGVRAHNMQRM